MTRLNSRVYYEYIIHMIFVIFLKMAILTIAIFVKNFKNHVWGEFVKIREFTLIVIFLIFPQNDNLG